jgi:hypothetical protein
VYGLLHRVYGGSTTRMAILHVWMEVVPVCMDLCTVWMLSVHAEMLSLLVRMGDWQRGGGRCLEFCVSGVSRLLFAPYRAEHAPRPR